MSSVGGGNKSSDNNDKRWGDTTSKKGEISRVFVGNIDSYKTTCSDLRSKFSRYGQLTGIDVHANGFAFLQFESVEDAKDACEGETGTMLHNRRIEVRMFDKKGKVGGGGGGGGMGGGMRSGGGNFRDRSPIRNRGPNNHMNNNSIGSNNNNGPEPFISGFHPQSQQQQQSQAGAFSNPHLAICPPAPPGHVAPNFGVGGGVGVAGPGVGPEVEQANEIEIIVISKDQWRYAELVEQKIRQETGIRLIDILFLHAPQHISMTLNDLFERRTLYALVVAPENEMQKSVTIHVLHNQMEYRNVPLDKAMGLIADDYRNNGPPPLRPHHLPPDHHQPPFNHRADDRNGSSSSSFNPLTGFPAPASQQQQQQHPLAPSSSLHHPHSSSLAAPADKRLPEEVSSLLRITIQENGVQFLSIPQIDSIIEYFTRERDRLTCPPAPGLGISPYGPGSQQQQLSQASAAGGAGSYMSSGAGPGARLGQQMGQQQQSHQQQQSLAGGGGGKNTSNLLDNPQVKQALNSLLNLGAIGNQSQVPGSGGPHFPDMLGNSANSNSGPSDRQSFGYGGGPGAGGAGGANAVRRHPLTGVEVGSGVSRAPAGGERGYGVGSSVGSRFQ